MAYQQSQNTPMLASTALNPALFEALAAAKSSLYPASLHTFLELQNKRNAADVNDPSNGTKKRSGQQDEGQRKNHAHVPPQSPDEESNNGTKKKPGRKPATTEPANKRTAQNRAAQRAFRERKERYVKELETRVQELEEAKGKLEGGEIIDENSKLRQRVVQLESENKLLRDMSFNFEFAPPPTNPTATSRHPTPPQQDTPSSSILSSTNSGVASTEGGGLFNFGDYSSAAALASTQPPLSYPQSTTSTVLSGLPTAPAPAKRNSAIAPISPASMIQHDVTPPYFTNHSSPYSSNSTNDLPPLESENHSSYFDDLQSSTLSVLSDHEIVSPTDNDLDSILGGIPLGQFSFVPGDNFLPGVPHSDNNAFASLAFQSYRDPNPFTGTFSNPFTTGENNFVADADFEDFLSLSVVNSPPATSLDNASPNLDTQAGQGFQQTPQSHQALPTSQPPSSDAYSTYPQQVHSDMSCAKAFQMTKDLVDDSATIEELCDIFKKKAHCSELAHLQSKILEACENGQKDEVMDLLLVCKEKKRMHAVRVSML
ncbi:hypothetical protein DFS34DRAFT_457928 [Phlyctochytrium arcticum]|nr:hypothetical protein DFS34DRAFT_457928 [Phlyctochytrium arcticum]